jgi:DNA repair protein RecO (recombination protein O)
MIRQQTLVSAYILHTRPYRESSLILELLTESFGRIAVVARGAKKQRGANVYQLFFPVKVSWSGRGDLFTLNKIEPDFNRDNALISLSNSNYLSGFYVNELLLCLCHRQAPIPEIFKLYHEILFSLSSDKGEAPLRLFERDLLDVLGYSLELNKEVEMHELIAADKTYYYELEHGPVKRSYSQNSLAISGATLIALKTGCFDEFSLKEAKKLLRFVLSHFLGERELKTRAVFQDLLALI